MLMGSVLVAFICTDKTKAVIHASAISRLIKVIHVRERYGNW